MRPIDDLRKKIDLWEKTTTDTAYMSVLHDVLNQIDAAIYEMDHQEAKARGARWRNRRMSDPIERGDVIGVISCFFKDNDIDGLADLEREINRLDTASPWHRVDDGLPDDSRDVIIFTASKIIGVGSFIRPNWYQWYSGGGLPVDVTYWMPIPEPPQEDA